MNSKDTERPTRIVRTLRSGRITIPIEFRRQLGIDNQSPLRITLKEGELWITPLPISDEDLNTVVEIVPAKVRSKRATRQ
jgi:bifunctional DNA-binding transcriptional regulator/antitoxin component of YhaV-PrlF toxin-antitoxin module